MKEDRLNTFKQFLRDQCDPNDVREIIYWINSEEARLFLDKEFDNFKGQDEIDFDSNEVFTNILSNIQKHDLEKKLISSIEEPEVKQVTLSPPVKTKRTSEYAWMVAAGVAIVLLTFLGGYYTNEFSPGSKEPVAKVFENNSYITKSTESGQKLSFHLSDGTHVKLNSNSLLHFLPSYGAEKREVWLEGEAFFEVAENANKPFIVNSNQISTIALGTSFTVRAFNPEKNEVFLLTGIVNVKLNENPTKQQVLNPLEKVSYNIEKLAFELRHFDKDLETAWKDGTLVFNQSPYEEVIKKLETWYGIEIHVLGKVPMGLHSSARFENDYLHDVMKSLGYSWGFEYRVKDKENIVELEFNKNNNPQNMK